jgi:hypothetical protein
LEVRDSDSDKYSVGDSHCTRRELVHGVSNVKIKECNNKKVKTRRTDIRTWMPALFLWFYIEENEKHYSFDSFVSLDVSFPNTLHLLTSIV